jgi:hypothetical protein
MGSSRSSEKLGKSLSKIKHGVLGKSIEGIVDNSVMDSAFDLADMYVSETIKIPRKKFLITECNIKI